MTMAAFMIMLMMLCIVNVLVLVHFSVVVMGMNMRFCGMATHQLSPPIFYCMFRCDFDY